MSQKDLMFIYKSTLRPSIDFAANTYHSLLTQEQSDAIERLQLMAMKIIYGHAVSYRTVLATGCINTLRERRQQNFEKFAVKCCANPRFSPTWFPLNPIIHHDLRTREKFYIPKYRTERGFKSPVISMRRYLNSIE